MTRRELKLTAAGMKTSLESFVWILPWMSRAPRWNKIRSPQSPLPATPSSLSTAIYHCCPFPFFQRHCHCCRHYHGNFFSLFLATHTAKRSLSPDDQCPRLQRLSRLELGGLPLPPGGSATNNAMSIPTAPTCFRSRRGHLNHWKDSNTLAVAVIVFVPIVTVIFAIVVVVAVAITVTITVITGCCHCCQDNESIMVFDISYAFLHTETGGCCQHLH